MMLAAQVLLAGAIFYDLRRQVNGKSSFIITPGGLASRCYSGILRDKVYKGVAYPRIVLNGFGSNTTKKFVIRCAVDLFFSLGLLVICSNCPPLADNYLVNLICVQCIAIPLIAATSIPLLLMMIGKAVSCIKPEWTDKLNIKLNIFGLNQMMFQN